MSSAPSLFFSIPLYSFPFHCPFLFFYSFLLFSLLFVVYTFFNMSIGLSRLVLLLLLSCSKHFHFFSDILQFICFQLPFYCFRILLKIFLLSDLSLRLLLAEELFFLLLKFNCHFQRFLCHFVSTPLVLNVFLLLLHRTVHIFLLCFFLKFFFKFSLFFNLFFVFNRVISLSRLFLSC